MGLLLFFAGIIIFMGIITGEVFYHEGYSTKVNEISDLGATRPPDSVITQPSATIFNTTMVVSGVMILIAMILLRKRIKSLSVLVPYILFGAGVLGVGIFPGNITPWHPLFAMTTFIAGGISAIMSHRITKSPIKYIFVTLGTISLIFLFFSQIFIPTLGMGGTERWVAYPIVFWLTGLGAYFLGVSAEHPSKHFG